MLMPAEKRMVPRGTAEELKPPGDVHECSDTAVLTVLKKVLKSATITAKGAGIFCSEMKSCQRICLSAAVKAKVVRSVW